MWFSSQPIRILTVTGFSTASTTAATSSSIFFGSSSQRAPASHLTTLGAGQPMLMSMMSALVCRSTILAASTRLSLSPPKICRLRGFSRSSTYSIFRVRSLPCRIALSLTISAQTRPTPNSLAIRRKAGLQTPAIGASTTLFFVSTGPIFSFFITAPHPPFYIAFFKPIYSSSHHRIRRSDAIRGPSHARPVRGLFDPLPDRRPAPGNPQIARYFQEGNQDEGPLLHPVMGNGQFLPVKNAVPV